ncbi:MAG: Rne/Rng family ribonuclease [Legionellales bacterium]|nr:Rne/Rng family ribonuclease [Legionellales bacterium]
MERMLINATQPEELRVAIVQDNKLYDLDIEHSGPKKTKANIYKARVTRVEPSLGAAFVDYGAERQGFLPLKEIIPKYYKNSAKNKDKMTIVDAVHPGQEIMVQVEKVERGAKGAALTTYISIAGCYLVLMPNNPKAGGVSKKIEGEDREDLKAFLDSLDLPEKTGVIIRTAGLGKNQELLAWDLEIIKNQWLAIEEAFHQKPAPFLIYQDSDIVIRSIRDNLRKDITDIVIDDHETYTKAKNYIQQVRPDFINKLKLYQDTIPLFTRFNIEHQIESAHQRELNLPSGGSIVIDKSEALYAIDINSAKSTKGGDIEETALNTNLEAAAEIARQLKIRDIGGLIVIDFIDMSYVKNQRAVENHFREAIKSDKARIQIGKISKFGLLELSRQRLRPSLSEFSNIICPKCDGIGTVRNNASLALSMMRVIEENALNSNTKQVIAQLPIEIATFILNEKRTSIADIEKRLEVNITIIPNKYLNAPNYKIDCIQQDSDQNKKASYDMADKPADQHYVQNEYKKQHDIPLVKGLNILNKSKIKKKSIFSKIVKSIFGKTPPPPTHHKKKYHHGKKHYRKSNYRKNR